MSMQVTVMLPSLVVFKLSPSFSNRNSTLAELKWLRVQWCPQIPFVLPLLAHLAHRLLPDWGSSQLSSFASRFTAWLGPKPVNHTPAHYSTILCSLLPTIATHPTSSLVINCHAHQHIIHEAQWYQLPRTEFIDRSTSDQEGSMGVRWWYKDNAPWQS